MSNVLKTTMTDFDGGFVVCGITGSGEMFSMRDPWGIRPAFYYKNDEIVVLASERPVLQTTFDLECDDIQELKPGEALLVRRNGESAHWNKYWSRGVIPNARLNGYILVVVPTVISTRNVKNWVNNLRSPF
jgi:amidophosphoribosyltransferase